MEQTQIVEDRFAGAGGRMLFVRRAIPASARGGVVLLHGYGEHGERYIETIQRLVAAGFAVYCPDHRGFGRSAATPGDVEGLSLVVEDVHRLTVEAAARHPGLPMILMGHSLGGMLVIHQLLHHQADYALAVASAPAVLPPPDTSPFVAAIAGVVAKVAPKLQVQRIDLTKATRNQAMIDRDKGDPLIYRGNVRARTGYEVLTAQRRILSSLHKITLPLLLLHGDADTIINPEASRLVYEGVASKMKHRIVFPGLYHEVFNEPERDTVFAEMLAWIDGALSEQ